MDLKMMVQGLQKVFPMIDIMQIYLLNILIEK